MLPLLMRVFLDALVMPWVGFRGVAGSVFRAV